MLGKYRSKRYLENMSLGEPNHCVELTVPKPVKSILLFLGEFQSLYQNEAE